MNRLAVGISVSVEWLHKLLMMISDGRFHGVLLEENDRKFGAHSIIFPLFPFCTHTYRTLRSEGACVKTIYLYDHVFSVALYMDKS